MRKGKVLKDSVFHHGTAGFFGSNLVGKYMVIADNPEAVKHIVDLIDSRERAIDQSMFKEVCVFSDSAVHES